MRLERLQRGPNQLVTDSLPSFGSRRQLWSTTEPTTSTPGFTQFGRGLDGAQVLTP